MRTSVDVHNSLAGRDVRHELFTVRGRLRTAERLAAVLELPAGQVGRVIVFESDGGPIAALVASDRTPDTRRVAAAAGATDVHETTGPRASELSDFIPDAIPPVGLPPEFRTVMDRTLADQEV